MDPQKRNRPNSDFHKRITLRRMEHRGARRIGLFFDYDAELVAKVKQLTGTRYSATHRCWYVDDDDAGRQVLRSVGFNIDHLLTPYHVGGGEQQLKKKAVAVNSKESRLILPINAEAIAKFKRYLEQRRYSTSTITTYVGMVKQFFAVMGSKRWDEVTMEDITDYNHRAFIAAGKSYATQNQSINALKQFFTLHDRSDVVPDEIERPRKEQKLPEVLTPGEVRRLLDAVQNLKHNTLLSLLYSSGLRIGEALHLELTDIRYEERLLYIRASKGRKDRRVPLSDRMAKQIRRYLRQPYPPQRYLFEGQRRGHPYSYRSAQQIMKRAVKASGVNPRATLHSLRHSYATHLHQNGTDIRYIQVILGHTSVKTTMIYTHVSANDILRIKSPFDDL